MTEAEIAALEAKVLGGNAPPATKAAAAAGPPLADAERSVVGKPSAEMDSPLNAAGYAAVDKMSLGALPWLRDQIANLAGNTTQLRRDEQRAYDEQNHPIASTTGAAAGTMIPALLGAGAAGAAGIGSTALRGAIGFGGADVADQGSRAVLDGRPFQPVEAALATAGGALGNPATAVKTALTVAHPVAAGGVYALKKGIQALAERAAPAAPEVYRGAAAAGQRASHVLGDEAGRAAVSQGIKTGQPWYEAAREGQKAALTSTAMPPPPPPGLLADAKQLAMPSLLSETLSTGTNRDREEKKRRRQR